jgi:hypothetical protein
VAATSTAPVESKSTPASAQKLAEAIREVVREEMGHVESSKERGSPIWVEVVWVTVVVINSVLLISQLPEAALKNTSFEFASKLVGYVFGGVLLVYSSWVKERLMALTGVRWFQCLQLGLFVILIGLRVTQITVQPKLAPNARLFVDDNDAQVHLKHGRLTFALGSHTVRITPKEGASKLPNGQEIRENQFTVTWSDLLWGAYRGPAAVWSPLYPIYVKARYEDSRLLLSRDGRLPENLPESQDIDSEITDLQTLQVTLNKARGATAYVPLGTYRIQEVRRNGTSCSEVKEVKVEEKDNEADLSNQSCPGGR